MHPSAPLMVAEAARVSHAMDMESREAGHGQPRVPVMSYRFKSGGDNHIVARRWDGVNEGPDDERIALPHHLQKQVCGTGYTYSNFQSRTHDTTGQEETIQPPYVVDGLLLVVFVDGTTGVSLTDPAEDLIAQEIGLRLWRQTC